MIDREIIINKIKLLNRISISPMCQYSADRHGNPSSWHYQHLGNLSQLGAGLLMLESTSISNEGRITLNDLVLSNKKNYLSFCNLVKFLKKKSDIKIGIQISHAGRKGSSYIPWKKANSPLKKNNWKTYSASAIAKDKHWPVPSELNDKKIKKIINDFYNSASLANKANFDCLEIHMAHGYLLHQFFSPISNKRNDQYGGSLKKRCKLLIQIAKKIRKIWPTKKILGARITGCDFVKFGSTVEDAIYLTKNLQKIGFDYVCVSGGGILTRTKIKFKKGYNVKNAYKIKKFTKKILIQTVGMMQDLKFSDTLIQRKKIDLVSIAREFINNPYFLFRYKNFKSKIPNLPPQYARCIRY